MVPLPEPVLSAASEAASAVSSLDLAGELGRQPPAWDPRLHQQYAPGKEEPRMARNNKRFRKPQVPRTVIDRSVPRKLHAPIT